MVQQDTFARNPIWLSTAYRPPQHIPGFLPKFASPDPFVPEFSGCYVSEVDSHGGEDDVESSAFGPSRLPPKTFPKCSICQKAIADEVSGLLTQGLDGMRPLEPIERGKASKGIPIVRSTMAVRYKSVTKAKARLCVRGDLAATNDITSAPTPYRSTLKVLLLLAGIGDFIVMTLDVSQAFLRSEAVSVEDMICIEPPNYLVSPWNGRVLEAPSKDSRATHLLLMKNPLYGLRESPLRRFLQLSR